MITLLKNVMWFIKCWVFFALACCLTPVLIFSFICVQTSHTVWLAILSAYYAQTYDFSTTKKLRSLVDTLRNSGIYHFLLEVDGRCDFESIKQSFRINVVEKVDKVGEIRFPKLRQKLTSKWGHYAWVKDDSDFKYENHVVLSSPMYKGRPVNDNNIQEMVSHLVTKYMSPDIPPWQVIVIPNTSGQGAQAESDESLFNARFYILVRIHHLLMAEEKDLHINEMLMLDTDRQLKVFDSAQNLQFLDFVRRPKHIPNLWHQIKVSASNRWNEFIYRYDPLESPDVEKRKGITCLSQLTSVLFISVVTVFNDFCKGYKRTNNHFVYRAKFLYSLCKREADKRNLTMEAVVDSILYSLNPINLMRYVLLLISWTAFTLILVLPFYLYKELKSFVLILTTGHVNSSGTFVEFMYVYTPMILGAALELFVISKEIFMAPCHIYEELFEYRTREKNVLHLKSYCGRKVVSFSNSIDMKDVRKRVNLDEVGEIEFTLACLSGSLLEFLKAFKGYSIPELINVTLFNLGKEYFMVKYGKVSHIGGIVFLQLPLQQPNQEQIKVIHSTIERIRKKQIAIYMLGLAQSKFDIITHMLPQVVSKILINYFSYTYPVTITEVYGDSSDIQTLWGQNVKDLLVFRPPQSKTCLSLTMHHFGDRNRLTVMADSQLVPTQMTISNVWQNLMETIKL